ncbi:MAG: hypothetical protein E7046_11390 [Lentisphaerae bacterium]|nr:hypothetical protein [Lentisphaerota bacterium]
MKTTPSIRMITEEYPKIASVERMLILSDFPQTKRADRAAFRRNCLEMNDLAVEERGPMNPIVLLMLADIVALALCRHRT